MDNISIKIKNYKCFGEETGFDCLKRVNVIIGRNNSGKSSLLDLIESVAGNSYKFDPNTWKERTRPEVYFETIISPEITSKAFRPGISGGGIKGSHANYGNFLNGRKICWKITGPDRNHCQLVSCDETGLPQPLSSIGNILQGLLILLPIDFQNKKFKRISAERDIYPERANSAISIDPNGNGATNAIQSFINRTDLSSELVEVIILTALNDIFAPDIYFTDIVCQIDNNELWEIYLEEEGKGRIALSKSGSGLKTVILVLSYLYLVPLHEKKPLSEYIFGFEELENNIHPSLLRRLNEYIYEASRKHDFTLFLTTHSNVLIDQFSKQEDAQITHVKHEHGSSICSVAKTYIENNGILDDLDIRASDVLQSNGLIWLEGPSDRLYFNRWVDIWSNGELREGTHYQCLIYGGRLLSHLSGDDPDQLEDSISIFRVNRNSVILIDSDKKYVQTKLNSTKERIVSEFKDLGSLAWVTKGREIENYIPRQSVDALLDVTDSPQVERYDSFFEHIDSLKPKQGKKYLKDKVLLAGKIVTNLSKENLSGLLDLDEKLNLVCKKIRSWN